MGINLDRRYLAAIALILLVAFAGGIKYQSYNESRRQEEQLLLEELNLPKSALEEQEEEEESLIQVYVCGEVKYPGIYQLKPGGRVHQVIDMAVALEEAELSYLGMARELIDGETIVVPLLGDVEKAGLTAGTPMGHSKVNINQASAEEMASKLSGIGPVLAQRIVDYRSAQGPFQDIEDLKQVSGIGDKKYNDIKEMICVR